MECHDELLWQRAVQCLGQTDSRNRSANELIAASRPAALPQASVDRLVAAAIRSDQPAAHRRASFAPIAAAGVLMLAMVALAARNAVWIWPSHRPAVAVSSLGTLVTRATASTDERERFEAVAGIDDMAMVALHTLVSLRDEASAGDLGQLAATTLAQLTRGGAPLTRTWSEADLRQLVATAKDTAAARSIRCEATRRLGEVAAGCLATMRATTLADARLDAHRRSLLAKRQDQLGASPGAGR